MPSVASATRAEAAAPVEMHGTYAHCPPDEGNHEQKQRDGVMRIKDRNVSAIEAGNRDEHRQSDQQGWWQKPFRCEAHSVRILTPLGRTDIEGVPAQAAGVQQLRSVERPADMVTAQADGQRAG